MTQPEEENGRPRDSFEAILVTIWENILGVRPIGLAANFFELGGNSRLALQLVSEVKKITGKNIALSALADHATVERLAGILRQSPERLSYPLVMDLRRAGRLREVNSCQPPLFCVAAPGNNTQGFITLARYLPLNQRVYKLQAPRPGKPAAAWGDRPYTQAEWKDMANEYLQGMCSVQPHGPYYLGGICGGARIAFEMASQLESQGEQVALLAIFDTWVIENTSVWFLWRINQYRSRVRQILNLAPAERARALKHILRRSIHSIVTRWFTPAGSPRLSYSDSLPVIHTRPLSWEEAQWPGADFAPSVYGGRVAIFRRRQQPFYKIRDRALGWGKWARAGAEVFVIRAPLHRHLLREPQVIKLATVFNQVLERAQLAARARK